MVPLTLGLFVASAVAGTLLVRAAMWLAPHIGAVDRPGPLKPHRRIIPLLGGLGIATATLAGVGAGRLASPLPGSQVHWAAVLGLLLAAGCLWGLGLVDDLKGLRPRDRLLAELIIGAAVTAHLSRTGGLIPLWAVPLGALWLAGVMNAVNMLDGLDGLAGSLGLVAGAFAAAGLGGAASPFGVAAIGLAGGCLGFLFFNRPPARVFMGDNGSLFIGGLLGGLPLAALAHGVDNGPAPSLGLGIALMLGVPVSDMLLAITRRVLAGRPPFKGDRSHVYDQLRDRWGCSNRETLVIVFLCHVVFGLLGLMACALRPVGAIVLSCGALIAVAAALAAGGFLRVDASAGPSPG
jgi:UDP-GlcNAc:undecaprenyl-phosphate GlcNAc-1-phosphate transferase